MTGHIIPWNYPLGIASRTLAPALAAGNSCVLKPAEQAPLTSVRIAELALEAGFPAGVLNVVLGLGAEAGAALAGHLVHRDVHGDLLARLKTIFARTTIGAGHTDPDLGPVISALQHQRVGELGSGPIDLN